MSSDIALKGENVLFILIREILFEFISDTYVVCEGGKYQKV